MGWLRRRRLDRELAREAHDLQDRAAGVASVKLYCHGDAWALLAATAGLRLGGVDGDRVVAQDDGLVEVTLSGPNLVSLLKATNLHSKAHRDLNRMVFQDAPSGAYNIAMRLREEIRHALEATQSTTATGTAGSPIPPLRLVDSVPEA